MSSLWKVLVALLGCLAVIGGVIAANKWMRGQLDRRGHYDLVITDLAVPAPPGMTRVEFLSELFLVSAIPDKLDRTDPKTPERLKDAFAKHPWVESVAVDLTSHEPVKLHLRQRTMAVGPRVVDRKGVLLPLRTSTADLPTYQGPIKEVGVPSGSPYPDAGVVAVAQTIGWLNKQAPTLKWKSAEITADGMVLLRSDGAKAVWGFAKGNEPTPEKKLERLKEWSGGMIDLRK